MQTPRLLLLAFSAITATTPNLAIAQPDALCHPLTRETCAVPFPADHWSHTDTGSPTGIRLSVPDTVLRDEVLAQLPAEDGLTPAGIFSGSSGFSAASAVIFSFPSRPSAPIDEAAVQAWNLTQLEPREIRAQLSEFARSDAVSAPSEVLEVFPRDRWDYGEQMLVAVTDKLDVPGDNERVDSLCARHAAGSAGERSCAALLAALARVGLPAAQVRSATLFTVRTRDEVLAPMRRLVDTTWHRHHPIRHLEVSYTPLNINVSARITGELQLDNYRRRNGTGMVDFSATPVAQWVPFRLTLPKAAHDGGAPVVFYAHGLGTNKESDSVVTGMNAGLGIATFSIDFPNHGARAQVDGGGVFDNLEVGRLATQIGMMTQNTLDFAAAHNALAAELAALDVVGRPTWRRWCSLCADGVPDLNTGKVLMQGTSLGGVLGATYAALAHDLDGALFHVTGVGITSILSDSALWETTFSQLEPPAANGAEALLLRSAIQQALDFGDGINYIDLMHTPDIARAPRPLMIITGAGDSIVPNDSSIAAARLARLPQVGPALYPMPGVEAGDYDSIGNGIRHYRPLASPFFFGDLISDASAHGIFIRLDARADQENWMERFFLAE